MSRDSRGTLAGAEHTLGGFACLPRRTLGGFTCLPRRTLFGGYGPFVALVALILAMALLAPTIAPERDVTTRPHPASPAAAGDRRASTTDRCCK